MARAGSAFRWWLPYVTSGGWGVLHQESPRKSRRISQGWDRSIALLKSLSNNPHPVAYACRALAAAHPAMDWVGRTGCLSCLRPRALKMRSTRLRDGCCSVAPSSDEGPINIHQLANQVHPAHHSQQAIALAPSKTATRRITTSKSTKRKAALVSHLNDRVFSLQIDAELMHRG